MSIEGMFEKYGDKYILNHADGNKYVRWGAIEKDLDQIKDLEKKLARTDAEAVQRGEHCNELMKKLADYESGHRGACSTCEPVGILNKQYERALSDRQDELNYLVDKVKDLEKELALAEGEWKTYAKMSDELSKKLSEANRAIEHFEKSTLWQTQEKLKLAVEALEFYADKSTYSKRSPVPGYDFDQKLVIILDDTDFIMGDDKSGCTIKFYEESFYTGGKKARAALKQLSN